MTTMEVELSDKVSLQCEEDSDRGQGWMRGAGHEQDVRRKKAQRQEEQSGSEARRESKEVRTVENRCKDNWGPKWRRNEEDWRATRICRFRRLVVKG